LLEGTLDSLALSIDSGVEVVSSWEISISLPQSLLELQDESMALPGGSIGSVWDAAEVVSTVGDADTVTGEGGGTMTTSTLQPWFPLPEHMDLDSHCATSLSCLLVHAGPSYEMNG
jgi:hypothetical protein